MNRLILAGVAVLGVILGAVGLLSVQAFAPPRVDVADRARIESVVRDYILAHPEILPEAMQKLQDRETADRGNRAAMVAAQNRQAIETPFAGAWAGNPNGDVTLVEYFDYNCGYCRASLPAIAALLKSDPKIRIVYRDFPILAQSSVDAAKMSLAAAEQGKFQAFHDALYAGGPVTAQSIATAAQRAGLDMARAAAFAPRAQEEIAANEAMAQKLGLTGTPSWVIGRKVVSSALPLEELQKAIAAARGGK
ncbi:DsbA family protein [Sphingomonas sp. MMS24-J45]|uniref:DsbA family protein n=1 Tax=Sphingomonas sp. MMS24-J45 TaxID=3238806 RepID=UPI0038511B22